MEGESVFFRGSTGHDVWILKEDEQNVQFGVQRFFGMKARDMIQFDQHIFQMNWTTN